MEPKPPGEESSGTFKRCTQPILSALNHIGIAAYLSGRNDLLIDGKKFSGTAQCQIGGRILLHGTLLYTSALSNLSQALQGPRTKFTQKAVPSTPSPICNISSHMQDAPPIEQFMEYLSQHLYGQTYVSAPYTYTPQDLTAIELLATSKYRTHLWNWGDEPQFSHQTDLKTDFGTLQLHFDTDTNGLISRIHIFGDYISNFEREALEARLIGCQPIESALKQALI